MVVQARLLKYVDGGGLERNEALLQNHFDNCFVLSFTARSRPNQISFLDANGLVVHHLASSQLSITRETRSGLYSFSINGLPDKNLLADKYLNVRVDEDTILPLQLSAPVETLNSGKFAFIGGPPKSGTTWLENILNSTSQILCSGENGLLLDSTNPLRIAPGVAPPAYAHLWPKPEGDSYDLFVKKNFIEGFFGSWLRLFPDTSWVIDRTPQNQASLDAILRLGYHYIHVVRNPWDIFLSLMFHEANIFISDSKHAPDKASDRAEQMGSSYSDYLSFCNDVIERSPRLAISNNNLSIPIKLFYEFVETLRLPDALHRSPSKVLVLRYEELLQDSARELRKIFAFLNLFLSSEEEQRARFGSRFETWSGGRPSGVENKSSFYRSGTDGGFEAYFGGTDLKANLLGGLSQDRKKILQDYCVEFDYL